MPINSIFLFGLFSPGELGLSYQRAFDALGIRTHIFDIQKNRHHMGWWTRNRIPHRLTIRSGSVRTKSLEQFNRVLENAVVNSGAQALLSFSLEWLLPETVRSLRRKGIRVICFFPDNPFLPHPMHRPETIPVAREADLCLIYSELVMSKLKEAGVPHAAFLPFAWDPEVFPYQGDQQQGSWPGVLFLGTWDRHREAILEKLAPHVPLRIFGSAYWGTRTSRSSPLRHCWQGKSLHLADAARVIRESAVCLNILRLQHIIDGVPDGLIMRHFEAPGAGGFLLSTRGRGATDLFPEGESGEYYSDSDECIEKIKRYISDETARRLIADRAHTIVEAHHRYTDRAGQLLRMLDDLAG